MGFLLISFDTFSFQSLLCYFDYFLFKVFDSLTSIYWALLHNTYVVYCGTAFHEFQGILHNLQHFPIAINDFVHLDFVVAMLHVRCWSSSAEG